MRPYNRHVSLWNVLLTDHWFHLVVMLTFAFGLLSIILELCTWYSGPGGYVKQFDSSLIIVLVLLPFWIAELLRAMIRKRRVERSVLVPARVVKIVDGGLKGLLLHYRWSGDVRECDYSSFLRRQIQRFAIQEIQEILVDSKTGRGMIPVDVLEHPWMKSVYQESESLDFNHEEELDVPDMNEPAKGGIGLKSFLIYLAIGITLFALLGMSGAEVVLHYETRSLYEALQIGEAFGDAQRKVPRDFVPGEADRKENPDFEVKKQKGNPAGVEYWVYAGSQGRFLRCGFDEKWRLKCVQVWGPKNVLKHWLKFLVASPRKK